MNYSEDHIALAAEYALGTLDADERALVETMMIVDHGFMELVDAWEHKLAPLHQMVGSVEPPAHVWQNIKAAAGLTGLQMPMKLPEISAEQPDAENSDASDAAIFARSGRDNSIVPPPDARSNVVEFSGRKRGSRVFGTLMTAVAASLAGVIALQAYRPQLLPENLRIKPRIQVVEVKAPAAPASAQLVALLQQNTNSPAFILTVDTASKNFTVRKLGATPEGGKSYELWLVSDKLQSPRSLGVIGNSDFTIRPALASYDSDTINKATYAVTIEPEGGSPTGSATGPIVYTGKLIESVPAGADAVAPAR